MGYRDFRAPAFARRQHATGEWIRWLCDEQVLYSVAPRPDISCEACGGSVGIVPILGTTYSLCAHCRRYGINHVDPLISISYSFDDGLESIFHRYKDWNGYRWLVAPLGSLLWTFLNDHLECITSSFGQIDLAAIVPPNDVRMFEPMVQVVQAVQDGEALLPWMYDTVARVHGTDRPGRGELKPDAYSVRAELVRSRTVLLLDDTWTSGSSMASAGAALKRAGANRVVGLTLGRQLKSDGVWGTNAELVKMVRSRGGEIDGCILCA